MNVFNALKGSHFWFLYKVLLGFDISRYCAFSWFLCHHGLKVNKFIYVQNKEEHLVLVGLYKSIRNLDCYFRSKA